MKKIIGVLLFAMCAFANAIMTDDFAELEGMTIIYAGEFESLRCPIGEQYDCLTWPSTLLKSKLGKEICVVPSSYTTCNFNCRGLIATSGGSQLSLFLVSMSGDIKKTRFEQVQCPDIF